MNWKFVLGVILLIAWCVYEQKIINLKILLEMLKMWDRTATQIADEKVCDSSQWFDHPDMCEKMAREEKPDIDKRLSFYH